METQMTHDSSAILSLFLITIGLCGSVIVALFAFRQLDRRVRNLERQLKDFDVIPQTFDSLKNP